jgi:hypothetical protein
MLADRLVESFPQLAFNWSSWPNCASPPRAIAADIP